jgi:hypothetical protein
MDYRKFPKYFSLLKPKIVHKNIAVFTFHLHSYESIGFVLGKTIFFIKILNGFLISERSNFERKKKYPSVC